MIPNGMLLDGSVSPKRKIQVENFISECKDEQVDWRNNKE
jgi:hypothetical protein